MNKELEEVAERAPYFELVDKKAESNNTIDLDAYAKGVEDGVIWQAERILANNIDGLRDALQDDDLFFFYKDVIQHYGEAMAKWQAKRMFSEEDMKKMYDISCGIISLSYVDDQTENNKRFNYFLNEIKK